ncbi:MAG: glycosyltransferase family 4 protein [Desulfurellaceae bacterium]|nr:glycosyltransferase family 4 protein [Desulfurellaceae bacterium]
MRIVQLVNGLPPEALGGTETYAAALAEELARQGHAVSVFSRCARPQQPEYMLETTTVGQVEITRVNNTLLESGSFVRTYRNDTLAAHFGALLDRFAPDIVHVQHLMYLSTTCIDEAVRRAIPVVMTLHDYWLICQRGRFLKPDLSVCPGQTDAGCAQCFSHVLDPRLSRLHRLLQPLLGQNSWLRTRLRRLNAARAASRSVSPAAQDQIRARMAHIRALCESVALFLAPSRFLRQQFVAFGIPEEQIVFHECGLQTAHLQGVEKTAPKERLTFAYIGVVDPVKGVDLLVEAFQTLPQADLRIYGGEAAYALYPNERRFRSQLASSPHIRYMGRYDNQDIGRILAGIDVVVMPSIWYENAPLVIREAFLARTPVITADFGGMREWVRDGVDGLLFQARDVTDLRRQIARCITEPDLVPRLSQAFPAVRSIAEDAALLTQHYRRLVP